MSSSLAKVGHSKELMAAGVKDDFIILDTRSATGMAPQQDKPRMNAIATISAGFRGNDNRPNRSKEGEIYIHGDAPGLAAALKKNGGKSLTVMFPSNDPREFIQQRFAEYTASALKTYGDQNSVTEIRGEERATFLAGTPEYASAIARCKVSVSVYFLLAEWVKGGADMVFHDGLGLYRLRFTSSNSLQSILFSVQHMHQMTGGHIAGIPFDLFLRSEEHADPKGMKRSVWIWQAIPRPPEGVRFTANEFRQFADHGQEQINLLRLEAPKTETIEDALEDIPVEAEILDDEEQSESKALPNPDLCDAADYRAKYFAIAQKTRYSKDEGRAELVGEITGGKITSLSTFLKSALVEHADELIALLESRVAAEQSNEAQPPQEEPATPAPRATPKQVEEYSKLCAGWVALGKSQPEELTIADSAAIVVKRTSQLGAALSKVKAEAKEKEAARKKDGEVKPTPRSAGEATASAVRQNMDAEKAKSQALDDVEGNPFDGDGGEEESSEDDATARQLGDLMAAALKAGFAHGGDVADLQLIERINHQKQDFAMKRNITTIEGQSITRLCMITAALEQGRLTPVQTSEVTA